MNSVIDPDPSQSVYVSSSSDVLLDTIQPSDLPVSNSATDWDSGEEFPCSGLTVEQIYEEFESDLQKQFDSEIHAASTSHPVFLQLL